MDVAEYGGKSEEEEQHCGGDEGVKQCEVVSSHTLGGQRAVVVSPDDTHVAIVAVFDPEPPNDATSLAKSLVGFFLTQGLLEVVNGLSGKPWVGQQQTGENRLLKQIHQKSRYYVEV